MSITAEELAVEHADWHRKNIFGEHLDNIDIHVTVIANTFYVNLYAILTPDSPYEEETGRFIETACFRAEKLDPLTTPLQFQRSFKNFDDAIEEQEIEIPAELVARIKTFAEWAMLEILRKPAHLITAAVGPMRAAFDALMHGITNNAEEAMRELRCKSQRDYIEELDAGGMVDEIICDFIPTDSTREEAAAEAALHAIFRYFKEVATK